MDLTDPQLKMINTSVFSLVRGALRTVLRQPALFFSILGMLFHQRNFAARRRICKKKGIQIPTFMIYSVTGGCNLQCEGCYHHEIHKAAAPEMTDEQAESLIRQSEELGIGFILLAGGEPLTRKGLFALTSKFKNIIFPVFSNGLLLDDMVLKKLEKQRNVIMVISLEGRDMETDRRRGKGVYSVLKEKMILLKKKGVFWGVSFTVTHGNFAAITDGELIRELIDLGCRLFFYVEYMPIKEKSGESVPTLEQREQLPMVLETHKKKFPALFISFPQDEEKFGGCLSSGRGFVHVNPSGGLEPCPFAPFSDADITKTPLLDALQSPFLKEIRDRHSILSEKKGVCALWENKDWVSKTHRRITSR